MYVSEKLHEPEIFIKNLHNIFKIHPWVCEVQNYGTTKKNGARLSEFRLGYVKSKIIARLKKQKKVVQHSEFRLTPTKKYFTKILHNLKKFYMILDRVDRCFLQL